MKSKYDQRPKIESNLFQYELKTNSLQIIDNVKTSAEESGAALRVRVSFTGYRDHCDGGPERRYLTKSFTTDADSMKRFIANNVTADGGGDWPEDITGGMRKCLDLNWSAGGSYKQVRS
jgi:hypothetical protein